MSSVTQETASIGTIGGYAIQSHRSAISGFMILKVWKYTSNRTRGVSVLCEHIPDDDALKLARGLLPKGWKIVKS